ncbi:MAG TPA: DUF2919 family protein [Chromatiaceae bacterium]|nr:DUF2919 family protein [Chromatiaceae bacterium]
MSLRYPPERYTDDLILCVPPVLWLVMLFLVRHLILLGITFLPTMGREVEILRTLVRPWYLPADLLALPVLIAAARRRAEAGPVWRLVWPRGRVLLTLSALAYPILALGGLMASGRPLALGLDGMILGSTLASLAVVAYLWRSPLARDSFREFPPHPATKPDRPG